MINDETIALKELHLLNKDGHRVWAGQEIAYFTKFKLGGLFYQIKKTGLKSF
jgi:hypothetical protein